MVLRGHVEDVLQCPLGVCQGTSQECINVGPNENEMLVVD